MSGFSPKVKTLIEDRADGLCEICGHAFDFHILGRSYHHRKPRGMGGSSKPDVSSAANGLLICGDGVRGCHGHVESNRVEAYNNGWLVHRNHSPFVVPVKLWHGWVLLDGLGNSTPIGKEVA